MLFMRLMSMVVDFSITVFSVILSFLFDILILNFFLIIFKKIYQLFLNFKNNFIRYYRNYNIQKYSFFLFNEGFFL
jgi:hypothetical protein